MAAAASLLVATAAVAATDLFSTGTVIEGSTTTERTPDVQPPVARMGVDQTVVATGNSIVGQWQLRSHASERVADPETGEVYQRAGMGCVKLVLTTPPPGAPTGGGACGAEPSFLAATLPVASEDRTTVLVYGRAPESAKRVVLSGADGTRLAAETHPADVGRAWLIEVPVGVPRAQVRWIGENGARSEPDDVADELEPDYVDARLGR